MYQMVKGMGMMPEMAEKPFKRHEFYLATEETPEGTVGVVLLPMNFNPFLAMVSLFQEKNVQQSISDFKFTRMGVWDIRGGSCNNPGCPMERYETKDMLCGKDLVKGVNSSICMCCEANRQLIMYKKRLINAYNKRMGITV